MASAAVVAGVLLLWSTVANLRWGDRGYVVRNVVATGALVLAAGALGAPPADLGLAPQHAAAGLRWGAAAAALAGAALLAGVALAPRVRLVAALLGDARASLPRGAVVYQTLLRIPVGTAVFEEVAFRGVLLALLLDVRAPAEAVAWSSVVFGLWHVPPTIVTLRVNGLPPRSGAGVRAIAGAVVVTTVAGGVFAALRLGSGSLLAPVLAHWATNAGGLLAARSTNSARHVAGRT